MEGLTIITNNVPRDVVEGWELTAAERDQFDYINWEKVEACEESASFVRYRGEIYDLGDIPAVDRRPNFAPEWLLGWDGWASDSFFSGILVRYCDDNESVVMGRYYS